MEILYIFDPVTVINSCQKGLKTSKGLTYVSGTNLGVGDSSPLLDSTQHPASLSLSLFTVNTLHAVYLIRLTTDERLVNNYAQCPLVVVLD